MILIFKISINKFPNPNLKRTKLIANNIISGINLKSTLYSFKNFNGDLFSIFKNKKKQIVDNNKLKENPISSLNLK